MRPPETVNVLDKHGGFTAEMPQKHGYSTDSVWRPGKLLRRGTTGTLIDFDEHSFYQTNNNVTRARYKVPGYRFPVLIWFDNETGERQPKGYGDLGASRDVCVLDKHGETHCGRPEAGALGGLGASVVGTNKHGTRIEVVDLGGVHGERPAGMMYANGQEKFWKHSWVVGFNTTNYGILVNADSEDDAIDAAADYAEEQGYEGYFLSDAEAAEWDKDGYEYGRVGNHGLAVNLDNVWVARRKNVPSASVVLSDDAPGGIGDIA